MQPVFKYRPFFQKRLLYFFNIIKLSQIQKHPNNSLQLAAHRGQIPNQEFGPGLRKRDGQVVGPEHRHRLPQSR